MHAALTVETERALRASAVPALLGARWAVRQALGLDLGHPRTALI